MVFPSFFHGSSCVLTNRQVTQHLKWAVKFHRVRGVHVTPTVFVNGLEVRVVDGVNGVIDVVESLSLSLYIYIYIHTCVMLLCMYNIYIYIYIYYYIIIMIVIIYNFVIFQNEKHPDYVYRYIIL